MRSKFQKLQNRAICAIIGCIRRTPISVMLSALQWQSVTQRITFITLTFLFKLVNNLLSKSLLSLDIKNNEMHRYRKELIIILDYSN